MTGVLTAVGNRWDSRIATLLEGSRDVHIVRRCADLADLVATASAGLGTVALVSGDLRGLDLSTVAQLRSLGLHVVGIAATQNRDGIDDGEDAERHLRQLGITCVVAGGSDLPTFEAALTQDADTRLADRVEHDPDADDPDAELQRLTLLDRGGADAQRPGVPDAGTGRTGLLDRLTVATHDAAGGDASLDSQDQPPARIVAVWGPTGAPGRTTVAVTLASELAALGIPTVLVDADTYGGSVAQALSFLDEAPGLAAATRAADHGTLDLPVLARLAPVAAPGLRVLTGIPKAERWTEIRPAALERVLTLTRSLGQVVVIDCGFNLEDDEELSYDTLAPRRNAATLTALAVADHVVAVGGCDPVGLQRLVRGLQDLGSVPSAAPTVVVNRVRASAVGSHPEGRVSDALARFAGIDDVLFIPDDPSSLDTALLEGRALVECAPHSPVRVAVQALATAVAGAPAATGRRRRRRG